MYIYSDDEERGLPNVEVFYVDVVDYEQGWDDIGYYYWYCFPGCLPDSDPFGPFDTEQEAIDDMRKYAA